MVHRRELEKLTQEIKESFSSLQKNISIQSTTEKSFSSLKTLPYPSSLESKHILSSLPLPQKAFILDLDTSLELSSSASYYFSVENNCKVTFDLLSKNNLFVSLFFRIKKGTCLDLSLLQSGNVHTSCTVFLEENASLSTESFFFGEGSFFFHSLLEENTHSNLFLSALTKKKLFLSSTQEHLGEFSSSELKTQSFVCKGGNLVCDGKVHINSNAHNASGIQKLKGMILDKDSSLSTEPILEVDTNDVQCSHAASVSKLSVEQLLYLQARGFSEEEILKLLLDGVFSTQDLERDLLIKRQLAEELKNP